MVACIPTGLWFPSESAVWPAIWGQRPVQRNIVEEVGAGFQVGFAVVWCGIMKMTDQLCHLSNKHKCAQTSNSVLFHREIFELDNYSPIPVETEEEYKLVVSRFPFHDAEIEKVTSSSTLDS